MFAMLAKIPNSKKNITGEEEFICGLKITYTIMLDKTPPTVPPIAPDQVFLGLNLGQSFLPPNKVPTKYANVSEIGEITNARISIINALAFVRFVKYIKYSKIAG